MRQLTEITELSDTELEAVSGGFLNFSSVWQNNYAANVNFSAFSDVQQHNYQSNNISKA